jgi:hypothetical protein
MSRSKSKIVVTLLSALTFSSGASAKDFGVKNFNSSGQSLGAVGGAATQVKIKKGMPLAAKAIVGTLGTLGSLELIHSMIGGFTDSKLGSYSLGRLIRNHVNKNKQPGVPNEQDDENSKKNFMPGVNPGNYEDEKEKVSSNGTEEYKNKVVVPNKAVSNTVSPVSSNFQQNKLQSIDRMNQMVDQMPLNIKYWGDLVVKYLENVVVNNVNGWNYEFLSYISTGQGVITNCNYFQDHNCWCFGIEVTYRKNNEDKKGYVYLSPGLQMLDGEYGVKSHACTNFQNGLVQQWPDTENRGPVEGGGGFIGY